MRTSKLGLLLRSPGEAYDRITNKAHSWRSWSTKKCTLEGLAGPSDLAREVSALFAGTSEVLGDASRIRERIHAQEAQLTGPFGKFHDGTATLGELCYLTCRRLRPAVVVETGVAYGVTSAYILQALDENGYGELHSIDLPPLAANAKQYVGHFVPFELRTRWRLHVGLANRLLPVILRETGSIDVFVHDSLHTYSHMKWEFETALQALRPGGVIISDDVEGNRAFEEITRHPLVDSWFAIRQQGKDALCGALRTKAELSFSIPPLRNSAG